ncbi:hypothetical protein [Streptomyces sp. NPDC060035]|uniref:hypothetical protein n=1 Tax=Streptomyces sp. NPDC060035 TaxID=3347044 RepID=UPI0036A4CA37
MQQWTTRHVPYPAGPRTMGSLPACLLVVNPGHGDRLSAGPVEDAGCTGLHFLGPVNATQLNIGRGYSLQLYVCTTSYAHPHVQNMQ